MSADVVRVAGEVAPYVSAAASAYGGAVLAQAHEQAATATVGFGRRLAQQIFVIRNEGEELPEVLADMVAAPQDADNLAALRVAIRKALAADPGLATQAEQLVTQAREVGARVMTFSERSPATGTNHGIIATGDHNTFSQ